jgi:hypothetical protein
MKLGDIFSDESFLKAHQLYKLTDKLSVYTNKVERNSVFDEIENLLSSIGMEIDCFRWCSVQYHLFKCYNKCCFSLEREIQLR